MVDLDAVQEKLEKDAEAKDSGWREMFKDFWGVLFDEERKITSFCTTFSK